MRTTQNERGQGGEAAVTTAVERRKIVIALGLALGALFLALFARGTGPQAAQAASHREAPLISLDPAADITDFFMFRDYEPGQQDKVALIMNVIPGEEPSSGPNYCNFDPNVLYAFAIDNNGDGKADDVGSSSSSGTSRSAASHASSRSRSRTWAERAGSPPITALDGQGSEGLGLRQHYTVTMTAATTHVKSPSGLIAVPSNVGPQTMPNYASLADQGMYDLGNGINVFAGQREDPFYIDLGGVFDTLNLRRFPPLETTCRGCERQREPVRHRHAVGLQRPHDRDRAARLDADRRHGRDDARRICQHEPAEREVDGDGHGGFRQVQRLANPLVNEVIIGTEDKDRWNSLEPDQESKFLDYYLNPRLALALELVFGVPAAKTNRTDLRDLLLKYQPGDPRLSELLRLNLLRPAHAVRGSEADDGPRGHARPGRLAERPPPEGRRHRHRRPRRRRSQLHRGPRSRRGEHGRRCALRQLPVPRHAVRRAKPTARQPVGT